jgi:hypothetical protein
MNSSRKTESTGRDASYAYDIETRPLPDEVLLERSKPYRRQIFTNKPYTPNPKWGLEANRKHEKIWNEGLQDRIKAHSKEQDQKEEEYLDKLRDKATLKSHLSEIVAIAYANDLAGNEAGFCEIIEEGKISEKDLLAQFWERSLFCRSRGGSMVGFCSHTFDLQFIVQRSVVHGLTIPMVVFERGRFPVKMFRDVYQMWDCGRREPITLHALSQALGHSGKVDLSGSMFWQVLETNEQLARTYASQDAALTWKCFKQLEATIESYGTWT